MDIFDVRIPDTVETINLSFEVNDKLDTLGKDLPGSQFPIARDQLISDAACAIFNNTFSI
jgi:hypothetical protein